MENYYLFLKFPLVTTYAANKSNCNELGKTGQAQTKLRFWTFGYFHDYLFWTGFSLGLSNMQELL